MRREWYVVRGSRPTDLSSTSWNARRFAGVGVVMAVACFAGGIGLAQLTAPGTTLGAGPVAAADPLPPPETEIADAVTETASPGLRPAPVEEMVVVRVSVNVCDTRSVGSGVVIGDGLVLTAAHVVGDASLVRIDHGAVTVTGEVLGVLADGRDLALIAVDAPGVSRLEPVPAPAVGDAITVVGYPDGDVRRSIAVGPRVELADVVASAIAPEMIGVDVATSRGFSGGPAVDGTGGLVGIVVAAETATETALVIPVHDLHRIDETAVVAGRCPTDA